MQEKLSLKKGLIDEKISLFTYMLLRSIFIIDKDKNRNSKITNKLNEWIDYINANIITSPEKYIKIEYSINNLINIIFFIEFQNLKYCGDIIEHILIIIFSKVFNVKKNNSIAKYIYNNLNLIHENNYELFSWIQNKSLNKDEFNNIEKLFDVDGKEDDVTLDSLKRQDDSIFYNFLRTILKKKYVPIISKYDKRKNKNMFFINNGDYFYYLMSLLIYNKTKKYISKKQTENKQKGIDEYDIPILDRDILKNDIGRIEYNLSHKLSDENKPFNQLIRCFFTQVFIYYQNRNSPLLDYLKPSDILSTIPFTFDLQGALVEGRLAYTIIPPLLVGDFVSYIYLKLNNIRESGLYELGKLSAFSTKVKLIDCDTCLLRSYYLGFMTEAMGLFNNYSVEEINFSYNVLKEDFNDELIRIIKKFKNLKTLNLGSNDMHKNIGPFFVVLKKLYRQKKTKLECLILNKSVLNDSSFYELGELLKCKYCKLKTIYFSSNPIPWNSKFLKILKYNKSLKEIYLTKCEINDSSINDILKIMSFSNIRTLYLAKNKLNNFNNFLRILFRTKIITKKLNDLKNIKNEDITLINLDLSTNDFFLKNIEQIKLLKKILQDTSLYCLDICHILQRNNTDKQFSDKSDYAKGVEDIKSFLIKQKNDYTHTIKAIRKSEKDIKNFKHLEKERIKGKDKVKAYMDLINKDENSIYPIFMKKQAKKIIDEENEKNGEKEKYNKIEIDTLANYLMLENSKYNLNEQEMKINKKKLIII